MDAGDGIGGEEFEAGFEEEFFFEGIADLDGGAIFFAFFGEFSGGKGGTCEAVAARFCADIKHWVADSFGGSSGDLFVAEDAEIEDIDEGISFVALVEVDLAADGGDADTISVVSDSCDDTCEEAAIGFDVFAFAGDGAEAQGVEGENGACAHGKDIANDATDACGGPLEGFDGAGMIVAFHFESDRPAVTDIDDPGVFFARFDEDGGAGGGEFFQLTLGVFIGAMLAPHHGENAEFGEVGIATEDGLDAGKFVGCEAMFGNQFGCKSGLGHKTEGAGWAMWVMESKLGSVELLGNRTSLWWDAERGGIKVSPQFMLLGRRRGWREWSEKSLGRRCCRVGNRRLVRGGA